MTCKKGAIPDPNRDRPRNIDVFGVSRETPHKEKTTGPPRSNEFYKKRMMMSTDCRLWRCKIIGRWLTLLFLRRVLGPHWMGWKARRIAGVSHFTWGWIDSSTHFDSYSHRKIVSIWVNMISIAYWYELIWTDMNWYELIWIDMNWMFYSQWLPAIFWCENLRILSG